MGVFSSTCCVSGLPITEGDKVRYFLLTENPYDDSLVCGMHDLFFPRSFMVRADYNFYGSIENYDPTSPGVYAIVECLKQDLVEVGWGDNICHDVPTNREMSFEEILGAVWEERILVERDTDQERSKAEAPTGIPTLQRVTSLLQEAGFKIENTPDGLLVDEKGYGWLRIRRGGFGEGEPLEPLLAILQPHYAVMITAGTGNYANRLELQVMPLPGEPNEHRSFLRKESTKPLTVYQGMILNEVWEGICEFGKFDLHREKVQKEWDKDVKSRYTSTLLDKTVPDALTKELADLLTRFVAGGPLRDAIPFTVGFQSHYQAILKRHLSDPFTDQQITEFLDDIAGIFCLYKIMGPTCLYWRPSYPMGPQFPEYEEHELWHGLLEVIASNLYYKHLSAEDDTDEDGEDDL